jgi:pyrroline-5-carboxylate reductase
MTSREARLVLIGGGNMGSALLGGLIASGWVPSDITVVEISDEKRTQLHATYGVHTSASIVAGQGALVAVKPGDVAGVCTELAAVGVARIVSIAAGISVARLQQATSPTTAVIRAMPNTPALVGEGITAVCPGATCSAADIEWAESLLSAVGVVVRITEDQMDKFTAVAGSGPAYVFRLAEALLATGIERGLAPDVADAIVRQLFKGSGVLLFESEDSPAQLRHKVTSPNGTTAAGLAEFESAGISEIVNKVVSAAALRSAEMTRELS